MSDTIEPIEHPAAILPMVEHMGDSRYFWGNFVFGPNGANVWKYWYVAGLPDVGPTSVNGHVGVRPPRFESSSPLCDIC